MSNPDSIPASRVATLRAILLDTTDLLQNVLVYGDEDSSFAANCQIEAIQTILAD